MDECLLFLNSELILPLVILRVVFLLGFFKDIYLNLAESFPTDFPDFIFHETYSTNLNHNSVIFVIICLHTSETTPQQC